MEKEQEQKFNQLDTIDMDVDDAVLDDDDDDFGGGVKAASTFVQNTQPVQAAQPVAYQEEEVEEPIMPHVAPQPDDSITFDLPTFNMDAFEAKKSKGGVSRFEDEEIPQQIPVAPKSQQPVKRVAPTRPVPVQEPITTITADITPDGALNIKKSSTGIKMWDDGDTVDGEPDYSQYNQIDDEIDPSILDDDDDVSFIKGADNSSRRFSNTSTDEDDYVDDRPSGPRFYGYQADFSDDDEDFTIINGEAIPKHKATPKRFVRMPEENRIEPEIEPELLGEDMIEEKKKSKGVVSQTDIENNILAKLQKKHAATNKKGAYNSYFHFSGNPEKEADMFNHDMTPNTPNTIATPSAEATASATGTASGGEGCGESLNSPKYRKLFENLLVITGFKVIPTKDGYSLKDNCNMVNPINCKNNEEIISNLKPYIEDTITLPLQIETGEGFDDPADWCKWYTPEMQKKYPGCKSDIEYCDLIANHKNDFKF